MPSAFVIVFGAFAALFAAINAVQVFLGRQLIKPSASKRSPPQLRAESAAAAIAMLGASLATVGVLTGGQWPAVGALVMLLGWIALVLIRKHFAAQP